MLIGRREQGEKYAPRPKAAFWLKRCRADIPQKQARQTLLDAESFLGRRPLLRHLAEVSFTGVAGLHSSRRRAMRNDRRVAVGATVPKTGLMSPAGYDEGKPPRPPVPGLTLGQARRTILQAVQGTGTVVDARGENERCRAPIRSSHRPAGQRRHPWPQRHRRDVGARQAAGPRHCAKKLGRGVAVRISIPDRHVRKVKGGKFGRPERVLTRDTLEPGGQEFVGIGPQGERPRGGFAEHRPHRMPLMA